MCPVALQTDYGEVLNWTLTGWRIPYWRYAKINKKFDEPYGVSTGEHTFEKNSKLLSNVKKLALRRSGHKG